MENKEFINCYDNAKVYSRPNLEILTDDVLGCQHGATVGQIDEQLLFYLTTN